MDWQSTILPDGYDKFERHAKLMFSGPLKKPSPEEQVSYVLLWVGDKGRPLKKLSPEEQVSYLLLWVGDKGRDIHSTWTISAEDAKKPATYYKYTFWPK